MSKIYRCAIIGCGPFARRHASNYPISGQAELVACANRGNPERLQQFAADFGIKGYPSAKAMIQAEKPDIVHIVTPPHGRDQLMWLVSDLGVPGCIFEKPLACGADDYKRIVRLAGTTQTCFVEGKQFRFHPHILRCRETIASGQLGAVQLIDCSARMNIAGQGTHILDWAMSLNQDSRVSQVMGFASGIEQSDPHHPGPAITAGMLTCSNGVRIIWHNGQTAPLVDQDDQAVYRHCRVDAICEKGRSLYEEFGRTKIVKGDAVLYESVYDSYDGNPQTALIKDLIRWLETGRPAEMNLGLALHQWNVVLALYWSSLLRKPVDIPCDPPDNLLPQLLQVLADPVAQ